MTPISVSPLPIVMILGPGLEIALLAGVRVGLARLARLGQKPSVQ
jgi:hypothetical protein